MEFKHHYNSTPDKGEVNNLPSCTVPDMTLSIKEIFERYAHGLSYDMGSVPMYDGDENTEPELWPDVSRLDPADREAFLEGAQAELDDLKIRHQARLAEQAKKANQGKKVQRTTGEEADQGDEDQPDTQYPKKTRGGGAEPPNTRKSGSAKDSAAS